MLSDHAIASTLTSESGHSFRDISSTATKTTTAPRTTTFASRTARRDVSPQAGAPDFVATAANSTHQVQGVAVYHNGLAAEKHTGNSDSTSRHVAETSKETGPAPLSIFPPSSSATTSSSLSSSQLPRTSSLLPPLRIAPGTQTNPHADFDSDHTVPNFENAFNDQPVGLFQALKDIEPVEPAKGATSRPSSVGGLSDSLRNLNRWSNSTTSSRASPTPGHRRNKSSASRRGSLGLLGLIHGSPKKHKQRPSLPIEYSPSQQATRSISQGSVSAVPPLRTLPHITALPSLDIELPNIVTATYQPPALLTTNQIPRLASTERTNDEISADYWDGPTATASPDDTSFWSAQVGDRTTVRIPEYYTVRSARPPATTTTTMPYQHGETHGHSRNRSVGAKGSGDSTSSATMHRERPKQPSQKATLSKALQKANTAVQLDNAQNPESARQAYSEACDLLQQVLQRTAGDEDRRKLEAIRETYTKRIEELDRLLPQHHGVFGEKALPRRPNSLDSQRPESMLASASDSEEVIVETATVTRIVQDDADMRWAPAAATIPSYSVPASAARRQYGTSRTTPHLTIETSGGRDNDVAAAATSSSAAGSYSLQSSFSRSPMRADINNSSSSSGSGLQPRMYDSQYMPPPLSPRRPLSPVKPAEGETAYPPLPTDYATYTTTGRLAPAAGGRGHRRDNSHESVSWLDPIEESGGSSASSVHSRSSSVGIRRKHIRAPSGETEAEFDAALDDAIEAAYNEGYEPDDAVDPMDKRGTTGAYQQQQEEDPDEAMASVLRRVELAREAVRASEREAMIWASEREKRLRLEQEEEDEMMRQQEEEEEQEAQGMEEFFDGNDSEEEERFLEEMRKEYALEDFTFTASQKQQASSVPRESDSSGLTSRTWHSSMGSNPGVSNSTMLTTVSGSTTIPSVYSTASGAAPPPPPPPTQALPRLPSQAAQSQTQPRSSTPQQTPSQASNTQGVRSRRLSGQNAKQLKIETSTILPSAPAPVPIPLPATAGPSHTQTKSGGYIAQQRQAISAGTHVTGRSFSARYAAPSPAPGAGPGDASSTTMETPLLPNGAFPRELDGRAGSPSVPPPGALKKNFSSSSLRSLKSRNMSVSASNADDFSDHMSPGTPPSSQFGIGASQIRLPAIPNLPTPLAGAFKDRMNTTATGGLYLFDNDIHSPRGPTSPNPLVNDAPVPLEPCPTDSMLRPFWLMRCLYQTLCHPRGGYISNKLFVPRDVWRVKGVKLKNVEDKIANCDFLTAALQKLAKVDNCDADAVLEEMQTLEGVLEQVQASLSRKLGNEVGVHGASTLFKEAGTTAADGESSSSSMVDRKASVSAKTSAAFSWRRLRGKNSSAGLSSAYAGKGGSGGTGMSTAPTLVEGAVSAKDAVVSSLPMTAHPTSRPAKRDISSVAFGGPNANYMGALARLFDAAQTVDQIARQVEDPGLRHADKTQVGLELCTRHAAEFFGFYICRFVLSDMTMLLDKFIKRGSEWVLA